MFHRRLTTLPMFCALTAIIVAASAKAQTDESGWSRAGQPRSPSPPPAKPDWVPPPASPVKIPVSAPQELAPIVRTSYQAAESADEKSVEKIVADAIKKKDEEKKKADEKKAEEKKAEDRAKKAYDLFGGTEYNLQTLYDSLHKPNLDGTDKKWYEKLSIRGYTQFRFGRTLSQEDDSAQPNLFGDRSINGNAENFSIRRARLIIFGDVSDHLYIYIQPDFASTPQGSTTSTFFGQLRDLYADVYLDSCKVHRFRVGLSKVPYGWENLQSSQNRAPLDRTDAINSAVSPNERDLGVFYYWTPPDQQKLFKTLVDSGLKGSGNYGLFGVGVYDGQGGSVPEANLNLHTVARLTCPVQLDNCQIVEASIQGFIGEYTVSGTAIRPLGVGDAETPDGTGRGTVIRDERAAVSFVWYPQPIGFQAEWQVGRGPGLNEAQTEVVDRPLYGGYVMAMYRHETDCYGIITPYCRYQQYRGGYRSFANAPYGNQREVDLGIEWQMRKEMELVMEYSIANVPNLTASADGRSYLDFEGNVLRFQFQVNY